MSQRLSKADIERTSGLFNPVDHIVLALPDGASASKAAEALKDAGFGADDVLTYHADEFAERLRAMLATSSEGAGFGYEVTLMRRYLKLCDDGCAWVVAYAPDDLLVQRAVEAAAHLGARSATRYHAIVSEDLL